MQLNRISSWVLVGLVGLCSLVLAIAFFSAVGDKAVGPVGKGVLLAFGATAIITVLIAGGRIIEPGKGLSGLFTPKAASLTLVAVMTAFGSLTDLYGLLQPRTATESSAGKIEANTEAILEAVAPKAPTVARITEKLPGLWGEPGCAVVHRFTIEGEAVIMEEVGHEYRSVATIESADGDVMRTTTVEPISARGTSARLTYATNGVTETLTIADLRTEVPLVLDRCEPDE